MHIFLQLVLALLPCALLMRLILFMDRNEREPLGLVMKILVMGAIAVIPAALIEQVVEVLPFMKAAGLKHAFFESFLCAAPIEELCKLMPVVLFAWNRPEFNEENDGIVYAGASALGFALLENIFFVLSKGLLVGLIRALSSIPLHCFTGVVMGYYAGKAKFATGRKLPLLLTGFGWVYFVHGLYDTLCLSGSSLVMLLLPMMVAVAWIGMAVLKKGRQLSLNRAMPGPAAEGAISNVQGALPEHLRDIVFPKPGFEPHLESRYQPFAPCRLLFVPRIGVFRRGSKQKWKYSSSFGGWDHRCMHTRNRGQPAGNLIPAWQAGVEPRSTEMKNCLEVLISKVRLLQGNINDYYFNRALLTTHHRGSFWFIILGKAILRSFLNGLSRKLSDIVYKSGFGWNSTPRFLRSLYWMVQHCPY